MMNDNNIFEIMTLSEISVELPHNSYGDIFVIGQLMALSDIITELRSEIIDNLDKSSTYYQYDLKVMESSCEEDYNIVCPIKNPANDKVFFVVAKADIEDLDIALSAVINEAETRMLKFAEEALIIAAMQDPDLFVSAVDTVIDEDSCVWNSIETDADTGGRLSGIREAALGVVNGFIKPKFSKVSAKDKKEAFCNLPKRISASFEKQNSRDYEIVKQTISMFTASENLAILKEMARLSPEIFKKYYMTSISAASRYEIIVKPWTSTCRNDFKDRYLYCIYLKNAKGEEIPVTFRNYPAYCIYMMYIIDRLHRGDEVTDFSLRGMRYEFYALYKTIISETDSKINDFYDSMDYRKIAKSDKMRKGRYDEYIKDIHDTLETLVGDIDSIPLKVGHGRCLGISPEHIHIDEKLAKFKFA